MGKNYEAETLYLSALRLISPAVRLFSTRSGISQVRRPVRFIYLYQKFHQGALTASTSKLTRELPYLSLNLNVIYSHARVRVWTKYLVTIEQSMQNHFHQAIVVLSAVDVTLAYPTACPIRSGRRRFYLGGELLHVCDA